MNTLLTFIGLVFSGVPSASQSVLAVTARPGEDVVVHCDCELAAGVLVRWYRNCSHTNQPMLVLKLRTKYHHNLRNDPENWMSPMPRFQFVKNDSSNSYDLLIGNVSESDEGLYFCGTETTQVEDHGRKTYNHVYGNISTLVTLSSSAVPGSCVSRVILVPVAVVVFSNVLLILLYHCCQKHDAKSHTTTAHWNNDHFSTTVVFATNERKIQ